MKIFSRSSIQASDATSACTVSTRALDAAYPLTAARRYREFHAVATNSRLSILVWPHARDSNVHGPRAARKAMFSSNALLSGWGDSRAGRLSPSHGRLFVLPIRSRPRRPSSPTRRHCGGIDVYGVESKNRAITGGYCQIECRGPFPRRRLLQNFKAVLHWSREDASTVGRSIRPECVPRCRGPADGQAFT